MVKRIFLMKLLKSLTLLALVCLSTMASVEARSLKDLIKSTPKLYLPGAITVGQPLHFALKGQALQHYKVFVSPVGQGYQLPNGLILRVGKPIAEIGGQLPETGVAQFDITLPSSIEALGQQQFVDGFVYSQADLSDARPLETMSSVGQLGNTRNDIAVREPNDNKGLIMMPGDPAMANMLRSVTMMQDASNATNGKALIDNGNINRDRLLDRNLNALPTGFRP
jgi:hypothetical protein